MKIQILYLSLLLLFFQPSIAQENDDLCKKIIKAIKDKDEAMLGWCSVQENFDPNCIQRIYSDSITFEEEIPLIVAAGLKGDNFALIEKLLEYGAHPEQCSQGKNALITATDRKNYKIIHTLLSQSQTDINESCGKNPPLWYAIKINDPVLTSTLLNAGADPNIYGILYKSLKETKFVLAKLLLKHGANIDAITDGATVLQRLMHETGTLDAIKFLSDHRADLSLMDFDSISCDYETLSYLLEKDINRHTANLVKTIRYHIDAYQIVELLLMKGLDADKEYNGLTPLYETIVQDKPRIAQLLLQRGADQHIQINGQSYFEIAIKKKNKEILQFLINAGVQDQDLETAMQFAFETKDRETTSFLLNNGYPKEKLKIGQLSDTSFIGYLLRKGALINTLDLAYAYKNHPEIIDYAFEKGISPNNGMVVFDAIENKDSSFLRFLASRKADFNLVKNGKHPLEIAIEKGNYPIVKILLGKGANINFPVKGTPLPFRALDTQNADIAKILLQLPYLDKGLKAEYHADSLLLAEYCWAKRTSPFYVKILPDLINSGYKTNNINLAQAIAEKREKISNLLANDKTKVNDVFEGNSCLHWAIINDDLHLVEILVHRGANIDKRTKKGYTIIKLAKKSKCSDELKAFLSTL